jgi:transcription antitermination protein NusB
MSFSRSRTRRFLLQSLYTRVIAGISAPKDASFFDEPERIDDVYAATLEKAILAQEGKLLSVVYEAAPKYDIKTLPTINALILLICLAEIFVVCPEDVPVRVSVDEAIELAKRYSDDAGKNLINGILNTVIARREDIIKTWSSREPLTYSFFQAA